MSFSVQFFDQAVIFKTKGGEDQETFAWLL